MSLARDLQKSGPMSFFFIRGCLRIGVVFLAAAEKHSDGVLESESKVSGSMLWPENLSQSTSSVRGPA